MNEQNIVNNVRNESEDIDCYIVAPDRIRNSGRYPERVKKNTMLQSGNITTRAKL